MKFSTYCSLLALVLPAAAHAANASNPSPVAVFLNFEEQPSASLLSAMRDEVSLIMGPAGLTFDWRTDRPAITGETFADLIVLNFRGDCNAFNGGRPPRAERFFAYSPEAQAAALASTATDGDRVLPFVAVECDQLRRFVTPSLYPADKVDLVFGRAIGRVVAHEMYHIFAGTKHHGKSGVAQRSYRRTDLTSPLFRFTSDEAELLRSYAGTLSPIEPGIAELAHQQ